MLSYASREGFYRFPIGAESLVEYSFLIRYVSDYI